MKTVPRLEPNALALEVVELVLEVVEVDEVDDVVLDCWMAMAAHAVSSTAVTMYAILRIQCTLVSVAFSSAVKFLMSSTGAGTAAAATGEAEEALSTSTTWADGAVAHEGR
jgi:hypothetical protein